MRRKEDASAFIIALGILVILFIMAITFATMMVMESRAARNYNDAALCENVAYGALEEGINALFRDKYGEDATVVAGNLVLEPYDNSNDQGDETWDFWAYEGDPNLDETLWFRSDGGRLSEDASATDAIEDATKSWPTDIWQNATVQVAGQMRTVQSNDDNTITVTVDFDTEPRQGDRYIVFFWYPRDAAGDATLKALPGGLSARYSILITDDREARVNVNTAGNLAVVGPTHGSNMGASVTEVSLEALLGLFNDRDGNPIGAPETLAEAIILARCDPPGGGSQQAGLPTIDDDSARDGSPGVAGDRSVDENGVDDDANGTIDDEDGLDEDDEFNPLFAVEDTPFALPDEAAILASPADTGAATSSGASSLTDNTESWTVDEWIGATVGVDNAGADGILDEFRTVNSNTSDTLNVDSPWTISPGDAYAIYYGSPLEAILANTNASLRAEATGTAGLTLADCLTTYSAGTVEHPYIETSVNYPRYKFGLNQFEIDAGWPNVAQIDDLKDILETVGGFSTTDPAKPDPYQFIVNLKDALDDDSDVTAYPAAAPTYYGVELRPFITEVMRQDYDEGPPGNMRTRYYIELYNPSPNAILVNGWELELVVPGYPNKTAIIPGPPPVYSISGGGFFVIGGRMEPYVDDGTGQHGVARPTLMQDYDPTTDPPPDISAITLTCTNEGVLPDDTVIDKADGFAVFQVGPPPLSQERSDFKVDDWDLQNAGHTFTIGSRSPYTPDDTNPRGFDEMFALFIVPDYLDLDGSGTIRDEIVGAEEINYDIKLANLGDPSRLLVTGYSTNPADPALSQKFKDLKDNEASTPAETDIYDSTYRLIKFDSSYANHREVLDYLTVLNPMGDNYDDDNDGTVDDTGPTGLVPAGANDLGGPEHRIPGMININTASKEVLMVLPGIDAFESDGVDNDGDASTDESGEAADVIDIVIANRPYTEIGDLFAVNGFNQGSNDVDDDGDGVIDEVDEKEADYIAFGKISNIITTRSNVFTVYCLAQVGVWNDLNSDGIVGPDEFTIFAERKLMAIVDRSTQPINVRFQRWLTD